VGLKNGRALMTLKFRRVVSATKGRDTVIKFQGTIKVQTLLIEIFEDKK